MLAEISTKLFWFIAATSLLACAGPKQETPPPRTATNVSNTGEAAAAPIATKPVGKPSSDLIPRSVLFGNPERANAQIRTASTCRGSRLRMAS